jgi:protein-S-isoprenylcysteine O-methyltransferase Ste14
VRDLLDALGIASPRRRRIAGPSIWIAFASAMVAIAGCQAIIEWRLGVPDVVMVVAVAALWGAWTVWHSVVFPRNRSRLLRNRHPYRSAFLRDIFPGIAIGFSQMLRPLVNGAVLDSLVIHRPLTSGPWLLTWVVAAILLASAGAMFVAAWRTLGTARVGFVEEYRAADRFEPDRRGIYGRVRHPLFWAGALVSAGLGLLAGSPTGLAIAGVNLGYAVAYNRLEDRRLRIVFGSSYTVYASEVAAILPRPRGTAREFDTRPGRSEWS